MASLASPRSLYEYLTKGHIISDLGKRIWSGATYYNSTNYYKAVLSQYVNYNSYINIYNKTLKLGTVHTGAPIQSNILGMEARAVTGKYGKPDFVFTEKNLAVYVYKWKLNGIRTRCEVHFYKNRSFLVNYIYNQLDKRQMSYITDSVMAKYMNQYVGEIDLMTTKLSDRNHNVLFMDNFLMGLKLSYMSSCENDWYEAMADFVNERKARQEIKAHIAEKRFFNRI
ncbi:MAG: hypothetical protein JSU01_16580 [Bacteroidetes bacterium]|nr:hypothetical protein [Bacteroidota bacterium]